jgi:hypothetical protein
MTPAAMDVRRRQFWQNREPERLPDAWRMTKQKGDHPDGGVRSLGRRDGLGFALMIDGHGLRHASLCRSGREMIDRADEWRAAMIEKGWT